MKEGIQDVVMHTTTVHSHLSEFQAPGFPKIRGSKNSDKAPRKSELIVHQGKPLSQGPRNGKTSKVLLLFMIRFLRQFWVRNLFSIYKIE